MVKIFNDSGLKITVNSNFIQADFLDVIFNLRAGKLLPFEKPNDKPIYINTNSNHSPYITIQTADRQINYFLLGLLFQGRTRVQQSSTR